MCSKSFYKINFLLFALCIFLCFFSKKIYAQYPTEIKIPEKRLPSKYKEDTLKYNLMVGVNVTKMLTRLIPGGFSIDTEVHKFFRKKWTYGAEIGYTEYFWKAKNVKIHNKGFYFKPMISFVSKKYNYRRFETAQSFWTFSMAIPFGTFSEYGTAEISNRYYNYNPMNVDFNVVNQVFAGLEFIGSISEKIDENIYFSMGIRYAPMIWSTNNSPNNEAGFTTRYFPGSGYNLGHQTIKPNENVIYLGATVALFGKLHFLF